MPKPAVSKLAVPTWLWPLGLIALISLWRLAIAAGLPVTQDEAYYFDWARTLAWGYFDHPPGVAWLGQGRVLEPGSVLAARLGGWLAATLTLLVLWRFFWRCGLRDSATAPGTLTLALLLTGASLSGFASGVLTTPDTALALAWALALHEGLAALSGQGWRWLTTGAAVGLGLLGKYSMLLIGPVFLWAVLIANPRALRTRWPYLGALIALLVFSPNLLWNAQNDWLSLRFQFGHGFSTDTGALHLPGDGLLSSTSADFADPANASASRSFSEGAAPAPSRWAKSEPVSEQASPPALGTRLASIAAFAATQLTLFGVLLLPLLARLPRRLRWHAAQGDNALALAHARGEQAQTPLAQPARALLLAAALFPLLLFGVVASFSEVEPNWPAMYLPAAAALLVVWLRPKPAASLVAALANLLLLSLYAFHAATGALPLGDGQNRVLRETHGFSELAERVARLPGPVFADRYQLAAMLNFYQQRHQVSQWPGLKRPSEYSRGRIAPLPKMASLRRSGFWLLGNRATPVVIPGFSGQVVEVFIDCAGQSLLAAPWSEFGQPDHEPTAQATLPMRNATTCAKPLHQWWLLWYRAESPK